MLSNERERLERREAAKAANTVEADRTAALENLAALRKQAGYPEPVTRNEVGEATATAPVSTEEETEEVKPYGEWTNEELSNELKDRNLPHSGNKDELVARLEESDKADDE